MNDQRKIKTTKVVFPQIYSYTLPDLPANEGSQKIGYTERKNVDDRIYEQTHTAAFQLNPIKLWSAPAFFSDNITDFNDKAFHSFLKKSGIENKVDLGKEWFYFNGTPEKSKQLFNSFRENGFSALQSTVKKIDYELRSEQLEAVKRAKNYFENHKNGEFLWNAKPRFGKTLATYDLAKKIEANKVLIVTNRPAIANSWFDDFEQFIDGYNFISETSSLSNRPTITRKQYIESGSDKPQITFLSLQDLKGSKYFGGNHDKLQWIANLEWDLLVIDEAHEGIDTDRTDAAFDIVKRKRTLHLSGTPFKALANSKFDKEAIFNWTYLDEQKIKRAEIEEYEIGDHTDLPNLRLYTYRISQMVAQEVNEGIDIENQTRDFAFDLNEFFATKNHKFVHEAEVKQFLDNLTSNNKYPFSTSELRDELKHTFWYVGNRVESVKALEQLLKQNDIFKEYKIIVAAGDGKSFDDEENDFNGNEKSFDKVKKAIAENDKTITLSCVQLTTGVTVKEWSAVLMLTDIKSSPLYMQAAFRAQNPYKFIDNGQLKVKESAYLFDFAPTRVLEIYDEFANGLNPKATNGEITEKERKENIKELLNFFPVISEDINGQMIELDAEKVLTFPNALAATEIVKARFMTNLLFNDNIKDVFHFPKEVEEILNKMPVEKNKRVEVAKKELDLDNARKTNNEKSKKINENKNVILGEKIFRTNIERVVDNALDTETPDETLETLPNKVAELAEPVIAKYKEIYHATNSEIDEIRKSTEEKIKLAVAEFENTEIKDEKALKESLTNIIEHDFVKNKVEQKETATVETERKTKEEEIKDHLRAFTRTIPMFIMANTTKETITIDNFDLEIDTSDFEDLTNITKEEFHKLRDGFEYEENGERKTFGGVFDRYKFNASIAEFVAEKNKRSNYFKTESDIFELIPNQKNNQIFTPKRVVKLMIDDLEKEKPELFHRTDSTFIDLYMKSGMYITEIVKRLFINTRSKYSSDDECVKHILENQVYGLAPTEILHQITNSFIFGFDNGHNISNRNFVMHDLLPDARAGRSSAKLTELFNKGDENMKFDAVVGNPPYQTESTQQIFVDFYLSARQLGQNVCMIFPTNWQQAKNANGLSKMNKAEIKEDKQIVYIDNRQNVFPGITGAEWTNIIIWRKDFNNGLDGMQRIFNNGQEEIIKLPIEKSETKKPEEIVELAKIITTRKDFEPMQKITSVRKPYGLSTDVIKNPSKYGLPPIQDTRIKNDDIELLAGGSRGSGSRISKYVPSDYPFPSKTRALDKYKIAIAYAWGNMSESAGLGGAFSDIIILGPHTAMTETFLESGCFDDFETAQKHAKYLMTKFVRALIYLNKYSKHTTTAWGAVPIQDYSEHWWTKTIAEIDEELMDKYDVPKDIRKYVKEKIQTKTEKNIVNF